MTSTLMEHQASQCKITSHNINYNCFCPSFKEKEVNIPGVEGAKEMGGRGLRMMHATEQASVGE